MNSIISPYPYRLCRRIRGSIWMRFAQLFWTALVYETAHLLFRRRRLVLIVFSTDVLDQLFAGREFPGHMKIPWLPIARAGRRTFQSRVAVSYRQESVVADSAEINRPFQPCIDTQCLSGLDDEIFFYVRPECKSNRRYQEFIRSSRQR